MCCRRSLPVVVAIRTSRVARVHVFPTIVVAIVTNILAIDVGCSYSMAFASRTNSVAIAGGVP